ncbi:toll/interleukin-1 receptor domain-containing protein [Variovorax boronicumulans]|uniref:toll/interleukin-1 receptor domain-containing protein n=1 Tax=Variovorax boronicumulans TaxID=436515 RepID=UPI0036F29C03
MKVFLSWSGSRSRHLAEALRNWLPRVIQSIKPWMSDEDIAAGSRWLPEITAGLADAKIGILCVTPENQSSPWLVFEAGALSRTVEQTFVCPMLYDMAPSQLSGPLSQFQASTFERAGVFRVLQNLNGALSSEKLQDADLVEIFDVWWPKLEERLASTPQQDEPVAPRRAPDDILEEILSMNREQLRRENLRLEHALARDKRIEHVIPMFEQMVATATRMEKNGNELFEKLPMLSELQGFLPLDGNSARLAEMVEHMRVSQLASRVESQQLLQSDEQTPDKTAGS